MDYITPIKDQLDTNMHKACVTFCAIGVPIETPRYYNFDTFDNETGTLTICSTQTTMGFVVSTPFKRIDVSEFWQQFKDYRTKFIKANYPTIETN